VHLGLVLPGLTSPEPNTAVLESPMAKDFADLEGKECLYERKGI